MPATPKKKRAKGGGRKPGSVNKVTASIKAALSEAFDNLGGVQALTHWGAENPTEFYKLWAKMLPNEINADLRVEQAGRIVLTLPDNEREQ